MARSKKRVASSKSEKSNSWKEYERELQGRIKTELDSAAWGMKQHSWNELRQNLLLFLRVRGKPGLAL